ncbi:hypothetical protein MAR_016163 [Mya arenaria]|uniref:Uncharacterized protein n=1 Tax=Mya arenaria TaxID=6604 RepID=A0ABY7FMV1_MYAAR|nr:hypothetical protein MAR_016163 [Mya arenaria]
MRQLDWLVPPIQTRDEWKSVSTTEHRGELFVIIIFKMSMPRSYVLCWDMNDKVQLQLGVHFSDRAL